MIEVYGPYGLYWFVAPVIFTLNPKTRPLWLLLPW